MRLAGLAQHRIPAVPKIVADLPAHEGGDGVHPLDVDGLEVLGEDRAAGLGDGPRHEGRIEAICVEPPPSAGTSTGASRSGRPAP